MPKRVVVGVVTSDKQDKTRRVEISRLEKHPKYGKFIRRKTVCTTHDENNESHVGDTVKIEECPPKSKMKRWTLSFGRCERHEGRSGSREQINVKRVRGRQMPCPWPVPIENRCCNDPDADPARSGR